MGGGRGLAAIVVGVVALLVATVAIVLVAGTRPPRVYPTGSPEAAYQAYLQAWDARDIDAAFASFSQRVRERTDLAEYRRLATEFAGWQAPPGGPVRRVFIERTFVTGERAVLELTIEETFISGLSTTRNRYGRELAMVREAGSWRLDELVLGLEPWMKEWGFERLEPAPTARPSLTPTAGPAASP